MNQHDAVRICSDRQSITASEAGCQDAQIWAPPAPAQCWAIAAQLHQTSQKVRLYGESDAHNHKDAEYRQAAVNVFWTCSIWCSRRESLIKQCCFTCLYWRHSSHSSLWKAKLIHQCSKRQKITTIRVVLIYEITTRSHKFALIVYLRYSKYTV